jgi:prepilin-type N-terminal cleavage/methylation domain-containing protein
MNRDKLRNQGFTIAEMIVSLGILAMLLAVLATSLDGFRRLNHYNLAKQHCVSAAQATLDSIAATGAAIDEGDMKRLWPDVSIRIAESEGTGQWKGLKLVTVTANGVSLNKKTEIRLSRYFSEDNVIICKTGQGPVLRER